MREESALSTSQQGTPHSSPRLKAGDSCGGLVEMFPPPAHADGGAPQLAYVAGAAQGISIIDIAQRRVTGTIAVAGNPRTVLLSLDGHALQASTRL